MQGTEMWTQVMNLFKVAIIAGGSIWLVVGAVIFALGLKNKEAPQIQSGIWQIIGGAVIIAAGVLFTSINFDFGVVSGGGIAEGTAMVLPPFML